MFAQYEAFHASTPIRALYARELRALAPILAGVFGAYGLLLSAQSQAREFLPEHKLGAMLGLQPVGQGELRGDVCCAATQLPFASDSFNVVIAQHAFEHNDELENVAGELARILAPEGLAMLFGFNLLSAWRPWLEIRRRRMGVPLILHSAHTWRQQLLRERIDTLQISFPGLWLPRGAPTRMRCDDVPMRQAQIGSSWLLLARKRRNMLTPLRARARNRELALRPRLAPGAQREIA